MGALAAGGQGVAAAHVKAAHGADAGEEAAAFAVGVWRDHYHGDMEGVWRDQYHGDLVGTAFECTSCCDAICDH